MLSTEERLLRKDNQIKLLKEKLVKKDAYIKRLKLEIEKLKLPDNSSGGLIEERKPTNEVKKFIVEHREIWDELKELCNEWGLRSRNLKTTLKEVRKIFEPDEFGLVSNSERDVLNYIKILRALGKSGYYKIDKSIEKCYKPIDSSILFKHFTAISGMILKKQNPDRYKQELSGYQTHEAYLKDKNLGTISVVCSREDLLKQKREMPHRNDDVDIKKFDGEDLIYEVYRRRKQKFGYVELSAVQEKIDHEYNERFGIQGDNDKIILQSTIIRDELDDDLELSDFKEAK